MAWLCGAGHGVEAPLQASLLLRLTEDMHSATIEEFSQQDLADMAGMARETLTLTLNALAQLGAVELQRMELKVRDREMLEALASR